MSSSLTDWLTNLMGNTSTQTSNNGSSSYGLDNSGLLTPIIASNGTLSGQTMQQVLSNPLAILNGGGNNTISSLLG